MDTKEAPILPVDQALIPLAGYYFHVVLFSDGRIAAVLTQFCDALSVDRWSQVERIKANPILANCLLEARIETSGGPQITYVLIDWALPLWLAGFQVNRLSGEKRALILILQRDAVDTFSSYFYKRGSVPEARPRQQEKAPQPPTRLPTQGVGALSVPEALRAIAGQIETAANHIEQEDREKEARLTSVEQENQRLKAQLARIDRQQAEDVARLAEMRHELDIHTQQIQAVLVWSEQLEASSSSTTAPREEAWVPLPSPARLQALKAMPYEEYLRTPEWKAKREIAIKRALDRCQVCNDNKTPLHVHHRTYERRGHELPEDLFVLCESCHGRNHPRFAGKWQKQVGNTSPPVSEQEAVFPSFPDYEI